MENEKVYEFAYFKLKEDVTESDFLEVSENFKKTFLIKQPGLIDRKLVRSEDGRWCVIAVWNSKENALSVVNEMKESSISQDYLSFMDLTSVKIEHFIVVQD